MIDRLDRAALARRATESVVQPVPRSAPVEEWDSLRGTPDAAENVRKAKRRPDGDTSRLAEASGCGARSPEMPFSTPWGIAHQDTKRTLLLTRRLSRFTHSLDAREFPQPDSVVRRLRSSDGPCAASISTFDPSSFAICGGSFYVP